MNRKLFNPLTRFNTIGIDVWLPREIKSLIWKKIDELNINNGIDYLHVFEFKVKNNCLIVEHRQEVPQYRKKYIISDIDNIHRLNGIIIFVVDDYDYSMMMLSSEY